MKLSDEVRGRLARVRGYLVDMDGTLYISGGTALPGAVAFIRAVEAAGRRRVLLTNNSSRDGQVYIDRLGKLGLVFDRADVLTSGDAAAAWIARETPLKRPYVLGTEALRGACARAGLAPAGFDEAPDCVLLGYDLELTYRRLSEACLLVARGLPYFATHLDLTCIDAAGLLPDAGAIAAAIAATVGGTRPTVLGKPTTAMLDAALQVLGCRREEVLVIGDQLDTDIPLGLDHGVMCALVLTGETSRARFEASGLVPDLVAANIGEVHAALVEAGALPG